MLDFFYISVGFEEHTDLIIEESKCLHMCLCGIKCFVWHDKLEKGRTKGCQESMLPQQILPLLPTVIVSGCLYKFNVTISVT